MKYFFYTIYIILTIGLISSCTKREKSLKLLKVSEYSSSKVSDSALIKILKKENNFNVTIDYTLSEDFAFEQLNNKKVDLVIIPNNAINSNYEFNVVLPLLPRLLMVLTNKKTSITDFKKLLESGRVYFEDRSRLDSVFFKNLYYNFNIDERKIKSFHSSKLDLNKPNDSLLVYMGLTHINNKMLIKMANLKWSVFSIGDFNNYGKGSKVEGFSLMQTSAHPFIIPRFIYKGKPEKPILTIAINDVLLTRKDLANDIVYQITESIISNKPYLVHQNNIYNLLDFNFDEQVLSFPLHQGTIDFLSRNEPSVWMHYVNNAWPILSIIVILLGALISFRNNLKKKSKDAIEKYYSSLLMIKEKSEFIKDSTEIKQLVKELDILKYKAIEALANNKFESGESFNVFLTLYSEIRSDLNNSLKD